MRPTNLTLGLALAITVATLGISSAAPSAAAAQEVHISGPLAGAPAVRHMRLYRGGRFNVIPGIGYTLQDEYARSLFFTLEANYHFLEWLGVGLWGGFNMANIDTDLTAQIGTAGQVTDRNRLSLPSAGPAAGLTGDSAGFASQVGRLVWAASLHLIFVPLRGKLSLFQAVFVDTDLYIFGGVALFGLSERAATGDSSTGMRSAVCDADDGMGRSTAACIETQRLRADRIAVTPMLGVGMSFYANSWFGIALEWRAFPFSWNPSGTDESGLNRDGDPGAGFPDGIIDGADSRTTFNQMINIGLIFNLPPDLTVSE